MAQRSKIPRWNDSQIIKFLELYEKNDCLWNTKKTEYRSGQHRSAAYDDIISEMGLNISQNVLRKKIKNIRTTYHREVTKIQNSLRSGLQMEDAYTPTLAWFKDADRFLKDIVEGKTSLANVNPSSENHTGDNDLEENCYLLVNYDEECEGQEKGAEVEEYHQQGSTEDPWIRKGITKNQQTVALCRNEIPGKQSKKKLRKSLKVPAKRAQTGLLTLHSMINKLDKIANVTLEDEFHYFGMHVASQLRQLSTRSALLCQDRILSFLTKERLNALPQDITVQVSPDPQMMFSHSSSSSSSDDDKCK